MSQDEVSLKAAMHRAIAALPDAERSVFRLCALGGLDYPAIAQQLGISATEVEQLLASALLTIGRHLKDAGCAPDPAAFTGKPLVSLLHRIARWLGSG